MDEDNDIVSPEIYEILESVDWETLGKKMLAHAIWRGSTRYRITPTTIFARGYSIDDVISHIIQSAFEGKRKWSPEEKSLDDWLLSQVDSVMDWWLNLRENKDLVYDTLENTEQSDDHQANLLQSIELETVLKYGPPDLETLIVKNIDEMEARELYNVLYDDTSDEPELQNMILAMMDIDNSKPSEIAEKLGIAAEDIYNRKKRLKRRLDKIMAALGKSIP